MTPAALVASLEARGAHLLVDGVDLVVRPAAAVTPEDVKNLKKLKAEVLSVLRSRDLSADWSKVNLHQLDRVLEVAVPWCDVPLILAPGCRIARDLRARDLKPGRVWCTCEVLDLLLTGVMPEDTRRIGETKLGFSGAVVGACRLEPRETGR